MSIKNAFKISLGSIFVYAAMTSCVASERATISSAATTGANGVGGGVSSVGGMGGIFDPVPDAGAETMCACQEIPKSGSRLVPITWKGSDGSIGVTLSFRDTQRNEDCFLQKASDNTWRCMPFEINGAPSDYVQFESGFVP